MHFDGFEPHYVSWSCFSVVEGHYDHFAFFGQGFAVFLEDDVSLFAIGAIEELCPRKACCKAIGGTGYDEEVAVFMVFLLDIGIEEDFL